MKPAAEIRKHRDNLLVGLTMPCDCPARGHEAECDVGARMARAIISHLNWVLGEEEGLAILIETIDAQVKRYELNKR